MIIDIHPDHLATIKEVLDDEVQVVQAVCEDKAAFFNDDEYRSWLEKKNALENAQAALIGAIHNSKR